MTYVTLDIWITFRDTVYRHFRGLLESLRAIEGFKGVWNGALQGVMALQDDMVEVKSILNAPSRPTISDVERSATLVQRNFLGLSEELIASAQHLLTNMPATQAQLAFQFQGLADLASQIQAFQHLNLQWLQHIDGRLSTLPNPTAEANSNTNVGRLQGIERTLQGILATLREAQHQNHDYGEDFRAIKSQIDAIQALLQSSHATNPSLARPVLPPFEAEHTSHICRTFGSLVHAGHAITIPMDIQGRRPSTSLSLEIFSERRPDHTYLRMELLDGRILVHSFTTCPRFELTKLPGDALALLHQHYPAFLYNLDA
uniref:35 kDa protein n=1 Tax=White ash mosaic virus TaxID=375547 RepID=D7PQV1_9VIRU|nr:35 kDa protein [White ash mosaic virus]